MTDLILARIVYPLAALWSFNTRFILLSRKGFFPFLIFMVPVLVALVWRALYFIIPPDPGSQAGDPFFMYGEITANVCIQFILPLIALLLGTVSLSGEVEEGTLIFLRLQPAPRLVIVLGKFLAYLTAALVFLSISLTLTFLIMALAPDSGMLPHDLPVLFRDLWVFGLGLGTYGAVMMFVGLILRRSFITGIGLLFFWDPFAAYVPGTTHRLTVRHYLQSLLPQDREGSLLALISYHPPAGKTEAVAVLLGIVAAAIVLATLTLKWREFGGKAKEG